MSLPLVLPASTKKTTAISFQHSRKKESITKWKKLEGNWLEIQLILFFLIILNFFDLRVKKIMTRYSDSILKFSSVLPHKTSALATDASLEITEKIKENEMEKKRKEILLRKKNPSSSSSSSSSSSTYKPATVTRASSVSY